MSKFYRVIKETPAWEVGAVLELDGNNHYRAISDLWDTEALEDCNDYYEAQSVVEDATGWFERVYEVSILGKAKYLAKDAAKAAHNKLHKEG